MKAKYIYESLLKPKSTEEIFQSLEVGNVRNLMEEVYAYCLEMYEIKTPLGINKDDMWSGQLWYGFQFIRNKKFWIVWTYKNEVFMSREGDVYETTFSTLDEFKKILRFNGR